MTTFVVFGDPKRNGDGITRLPIGPIVETFCPPGQEFTGRGCRPICPPGTVRVGLVCRPIPTLTPDPFIPPIEDPLAPGERDRIPEDERDGINRVRDSIEGGGGFGPGEEAPVPIEKRPFPIILIAVGVAAIFLVRR